MVELVTVILAGAVIAAYFERKSLKADVAKAEAKTLLVASKLLAERQEAFTATRANVARAIAAAKVEAQKIAAIPLLECAQATIEKIEADLKKIL